MPGLAPLPPDYDRMLRCLPFAGEHNHALCLPYDLRQHILLDHWRHWMLVHCNRHLHYPPRNMLGQLYSGASLRVVPCDPFLQDRGKLLRLLLRIGWPVLRVHVWHHMLEPPDLVPRSLRPASLRRDRESSDWFVPGLAALPDYDRMLRCLPYVLRHCDGL